MNNQIPWYETSVFITALSACIASVISVCITGYANARVKNLEYKNLYYSKIIEKRLNAYEQLEHSINYFRNTITDNDSKPIIANMNVGYESFKKGYDLWLDASRLSHWYSKDAVSQIDKIMNLFNSLIDEVKSMPEDQWDELIKKKSKDLYVPITNCNSAIFASLVKDYFQLHDIRKFKYDAELTKNKIKRFSS